MAVYELCDFDMPKQPSPPALSPLEKLIRELHRVEHEQSTGLCVGRYARELKDRQINLLTEIMRLQMAQSREKAAQAAEAQRSAFAAVAAAAVAAVPAPTLAKAAQPFPPERNTRIAISKPLKP